MAIKLDQEAAASAQESHPQQRHVPPNNHIPEQNNGFDGNSTPQGFDPFSFGMATSSAGVTTENLKKYVTSIKAIAENSKLQGRGDFGIVVVTGSDLLLPTVCVTLKVEGTVTVYALLIEGMMASKLQPKKHMLGYQQNPQGAGNVEVTVDMFTGRCWDPRLQQACRRQVATELVVTESNVVLRARAVVSGEKEWTEIDSITRDFDIASLCLTDAHRTEEHRVNHKVLTHNKGLLTMSARYTPGSGTELSVTGNPIACDVAITTRIQARDAKRQGNITDAHTNAASFVLATTKVVVDHMPITREFMPMGNMAGQQQPQAATVPLLIVTEIDGMNEGKSSQDLRTLILGLLNLMPLASNHGWAQGVYGQQKSNKASLGYLGVLHDPWQQPNGKGLGKIDVDYTPFTQSSEGHFTPQAIAQHWCTQGVAIAVDVEEGGPLSWSNDIITQIGRGNVAANAALVRAADALFGGHFRQLWDINGKSPMCFTSDQTHLILGTYVGDQGKCDIRRYTYTDAIEGFGGDKAIIDALTQGRLPGASPLARDEMRRTLLDSSNNLEITNVGVRSYAAPNFLKTIIDAAIMSGVRIAPDASFGFNQQTRYGVEANFGQVYTNSGGLYAQANNQGGGNYNHVGASPNWFGQYGN